MPIYSFPLTRDPSECSFKPVYNNRMFRSPYSRSAKTLELPGMVWYVQASWNKITEAEVAALESWFGKIKGMGGRFNYGPPHRRIARGAAKTLGIYSPKVNGANQTGSSLVTDGWPPSTSNLLLEGDYIAFDNSIGNRELKIIIANASSDGSGNMTLSLGEPIRRSPLDNADVITSSPSCTMLIGADDKLEVKIKPPIIGSFDLEAMEFF